MRDPERIDRIISEFQTLWHQHPDWRFGQLIENVVHSNNLFYVEDDEVEKKITEWKAWAEKIKSENKPVSWEI